MLDTLFSLIKSEVGIGHLADILKGIENIVELVSEEYLKDGNAQNAAIDALVQILQQHKTK